MVVGLRCILSFHYVFIPEILFIYLFVCLFICLFIYLLIYLFVYFAFLSPLFFPFHTQKNNGTDSLTSDPVGNVEFDPRNIKFDFTSNSGGAKSETTGNTQAIAPWMFAAIGGGMLLIIILVIVIRRRNNVDNDVFSLKPVAGAVGAEEWVNPISFRSKRDVAFDNPIYDYLDSVA